jgi:outer membrane protein OmpA-like peptidoglycan-associated protein
MNVYGFASKSEQKKSNKLYTRQLSLKRVTAVLNYLTPKLENIGVTYMNYDRLGAGTRNLLNKDKTKKQQAANRRVEISTIS